MSHAVVHNYEQPVTVARVREVSTEDVWRWLSCWLARHAQNAGSKPFLWCGTGRWQVFFWWDQLSPAACIFCCLNCWPPSS